MRSIARSQRRNVVARLSKSSGVRPLSSVGAETSHKDAAPSSATDGFVPWTQCKDVDERTGSTLVQTMLPSTERAPTVLTKTLETPKGPLRLMIGASTSLTEELPGNGGFRLLSYKDEESMAHECVGLAQGMSIKHSVFNTGFAGAKVVVDASKLEGGVESCDKTALMEETSDLLKSLKGSMYTGCDMNTTLEDMSYLSEKCDYVLAAIGNKSIDPNACTAFGVVGALEAAFDGEVKTRTIVVHGCGNVGASVAAEMAAQGCKVFTLDVDVARADIPGCINISDDASVAAAKARGLIPDAAPKLEGEEAFAWWRIPCDAVVPCSKSGLFTADMARELDTTAIIGATNLPFATDEAHAICESRGVCYIPEGVSSAGAVIADSVEYWDVEAFKTAAPAVMYDFVRATVLEKTKTLLQYSTYASPHPTSPVNAISRSADAGEAGFLQDATPVGRKYAPWSCRHKMLQRLQEIRKANGTLAEDVDDESDTVDTTVVVPNNGTAPMYVLPFPFNNNNNNNNGVAAKQPRQMQARAVRMFSSAAAASASASAALDDHDHDDHDFDAVAGAPELTPVLVEDDLKHVPFGEDGAGYYSDATKGCFDVISNASGLVHSAVDRALAARRANGAAERGEVFTVADFGTADAGTSLPLMKAVIDRVRAAEGDKTPIVVAYEDQTTNDWNSVFKRVHGLLPTSGMGSGTGTGSEDAHGLFAAEHPNVFATAVGTTFYKPCFPSNSIDVAFSSTAMHWLSATPCEIPDALHSACTNDVQAAAAFDAQAAKDWAHIVGLRTQELKPGGQMVLVNFAEDDAGQFLGTTKRIPSSMHDNFAEIWSDLVTPDEFRATNFPNQYRTLEATVAPFKNEETSSATSRRMGRKADAADLARAKAATLVSADTRLVTCPYYDGFMAGENPSDGSSGYVYAFAGDAAGHAHNYVPTTRTWSNSTFLAGLSNGRPPEEKAALVDELFSRYAARVAAAPHEHAMDYVHCYLHVEKPRDAK